MTALLLALSALCQPQAVPPPPPVPADPHAIRGSIQVCEAARGEHRMRLQAGQRYIVTATSETFDPQLRLLRPGSTQVIAQDDDSGGGVTPRLVFTPPRTGDYVIRVTSFAPATAGDYTLSVRPAAPLPPAITRPSRTEAGQWQVYDGQLSAASPTDSGRPFHDYELRLAPGQRAMIHVEGANLDTSLQIFPASDRGGRIVAEDDDGGGGNNPFLFFAPPQGGSFVVRVIGFDQTALGPYRLRIAR